MTEGDSLARTYIASCFSAYGLEPAGSQGYFQAFPFLTNIAVSRKRFALIAGDETQDFLHPTQFVLDMRSGSGVVTGEAVFIGYGICAERDSYDDFRTVDLRGKVAVCYLYPPRHADKNIREKAFALPFPRKVRLAQTLGASAFVLAYPDDGTELVSLESELNEKVYPPQYMTEFDIPVVRITHSALGSILEKGGVDIEKTDSILAAAGRSTAFRIPLIALSFDIAINHTHESAYNVMGLLRGTDEKRTIVIGAHYDHLGMLADGILRVGADDNASGVSVMLELARLCGEHDHYESNLLFVAFGAEEWLFRGSQFFVDHPPQTLQETKAMINFDTVGRVRSDTLWINHTQSASEWTSVLSGLACKGLIIRYGPNKGASDSSCFYKAGIPVLFFHGNRRDPEVAGDEIDNLNFPAMAKILEYSHELLGRVALHTTSLTPQRGAPDF